MTYAGTRAYMAPQVLGMIEYGKGADIWSAGLIFYYLLTLDEPKNNPKLKAINFQKLELSDIPTDGFCSRAFCLFKCIYMKMIVYNEQDRATVEQVIDDEAFHCHYLAVETKVLVCQVEDLQGKNQMLEKQLYEQNKEFENAMAEKQLQIDNLKYQLAKETADRMNLQTVNFLIL